MSHKTQNDSLLFAALLVLNVYDQNSANIQQQELKNETYCLCALSLGRSLKKFGHRLTIYTNDIHYLSHRYQNEFIKLEIDIKKIELNLEIPIGVGFAAAHHKIDLLRSLGEINPRGYFVVLDLDAVVIRQIPDLILRQDVIYAYDITLSMSEEFGNSMKIDLEFIANEKFVNPHWFGGEIIIGSGAALKEISGICRSFFPRYRESWMHLMHQGDEILVSAAINKMLASGRLQVEDAGASLISRYWSTRTSARMPAFRQSLRASILHLPSDKEFLASSALSLCDQTFLLRYLVYATPRILVRAMMNPIMTFFRRQRKFAPRL